MSGRFRPCREASSSSIDQFPHHPTPSPFSSPRFNPICFQTHTDTPASTGSPQLFWNQYLPHSLDRDGGCTPPLSLHPYLRYIIPSLLLFSKSFSCSTYRHGNA